MEALKNLQLFNTEHLSKGGSGAFTSSASQTQLFVGLFCSQIGFRCRHLLGGMEQKPTALPFPRCSLYQLISLLYLLRISSSELGWKAAVPACQLCAQTPQLL